MGLEKLLGDEGEASLFLRRHRFGGGAETRARLGTHLDEAEHVAVHGDEIDLTQPRAELADEDATAGALQLPGGERFVPVTALAPVERIR